MVYSYPPFPSFSGGVTGFVIAILEWIIEIPLVAFANFFQGIAGSATTAGESDTSSIVGFIGTTWQNSINSFKSFGVLAPVVASLIWGLALLILVFFLFKIVQLGGRELEDE